MAGVRQSVRLQERNENIPTVNRKQQPAAKRAKKETGDKENGHQRTNSVTETREVSTARPRGNSVNSPPVQSRNGKSRLIPILVVTSPPVQGLPIPAGPAYTTDLIKQLSAAAVIVQTDLNKQKKLAITNVYPDYVDMDEANMGMRIELPHLAHDVFQYLFTLEEDHMQYVLDYYQNKKHDGLSLQMRGILVDWLVDLQENFELNHESLYSAVVIIDLYLSMTTDKLPKDKFQLLGAVAVFIASKVDERMFPSLEEMTYVCDDLYTKEEFIAMEIKVCRALNFRIHHPLSYTFLRRFSKASRQTMPELTLARYILETSLLHFEFSLEKPSRLAAASLRLANLMRGDAEWNSQMEYYTTYTKNELRDLVVKLNGRIAEPMNVRMNTIREKYQNEAFFRVANIECIPPTSPHLLYDD